MPRPIAPASGAFTLTNHTHTLTTVLYHNHRRRKTRRPQQNRKRRQPRKRCLSFSVVFAECVASASLPLHLLQGSSHSLGTFTTVLHHHTQKKKDKQAAEENGAAEEEQPKKKVCVCAVCVFVWCSCMCLALSWASGQLLTPNPTSHAQKKKSEADGEEPPKKVGVLSVDMAGQARNVTCVCLNHC